MSNPCLTQRFGYIWKKLYKNINTSTEIHEPQSVKLWSWTFLSVHYFTWVYRNCSTASIQFLLWNLRKNLRTWMWSSVITFETQMPLSTSSYKQRKKPYNSIVIAAPQVSRRSTTTDNMQWPLIASIIVYCPYVDFFPKKYVSIANCSSCSWLVTG